MTVHQDSRENTVHSCLVALLHKRNYKQIYKLIDMQANQWEGFEFQKLVISWKVVKITLRRTFTTAHSSSDTRDNFFFRVSSVDSLEKGFGQCGLPPKKKLCYLADIHDCRAFANNLQQVMKQNQGKVSNQQIQAFNNKLFQGIPKEYFRYFYQENVHEENIRNLAKKILLILFWAYNIKQPHFKAAINALEFALFDYFAKTVKTSLTNFIFQSNLIKDKVAYSFYTLSYEQNSDKMIENALQFLQFTSYIKVKYVDKIPSLLNMLVQLQSVSENRIKGYIIDANASWKPKSFRQMNICLAFPKYNNIKDKIMYIQQPFPIQMTQQQYEEWKILKDESIIKIMLDQSFSSFGQLSSALNLGHAINIKSQKAGGPINCIRSALSAKQYHLQVMLGSMVSTHHGCSQTYCLYPLTQWLDVDGSLLVQTPDLEGGFRWNGSLPLKVPESKHYGLQIDTSKLE